MCPPCEVLTPWSRESRSIQTTSRRQKTPLGSRFRAGMRSSCGRGAGDGGSAHGPWIPNEGMAGLDASCLSWLHDREVAVSGKRRSLRRHALARRGDRHADSHRSHRGDGRHLLDNLDLDELAQACTAEDRWSFLLVVAPLVLNRGTASPANPIAVF